MVMDYKTMFLAMLFIITVVGMWHTRRMKNWIHFSYTSESTQSWEGIIKTKGRFCVIEKKRFNILPKYGTTRQYTKGLSSLFPTKITHYDYVWNSSNPIDHRTGEPAMLSPEVENAIDQESALRDLAGSQRQVLSNKTKLVGLEKWMPYIVVALLVAVVYVVYQMQMITADQSVMKEAISDIYYKTGIVK